MKYDELEVGMKVQDRFGNEYLVVAVAEANPTDGYVVRLECTEYVQSVQADNIAAFKAVGDTWWIQGERNVLLNAEDPAVGQMLKTMHYSPPYNLPIPLVTVDKEGASYTFYVWHVDKFKGFELTLDELSIIPKVEPAAPAKAIEAVVSADNLKLGMRLESISGGVYTVVGYDDQHVFLSALMGVTTRDGTLNMMPTSMQIPVDAPVDQLSLKDFKAVE